MHKSVILSMAISLVAVAHASVVTLCVTLFVEPFDARTVASVTLIGQMGENGTSLSTRLENMSETFVNGNMTADKSLTVTAEPRIGYENATFDIVGKDGQHSGFIYSNRCVNTGSQTLSVASTRVTRAVATPRHFSLTYRAGEGGVVSPASKEVVYDAAYGDFAEPAREGYVFGGWFFEGTDVRPLATDMVKILSDTNLVARWTPITYTVSFDGNDAEAVGEMEPMAVAYGVETNLPACAFSKANHDFLCWSNALTGVTYNDRAGFSNLTNEQDAVVALSALWTGKRYWIHYHLRNGTSTEPDPQGLTFGGQVQLRGDESRQGYDFLGWATNENATVGGYAGQQSVDTTSLPFDGDGNAHLYAVWKAKTYKITFNANGGTGSMASQGRSYDDGLALPACTLARVGYVFLGWATSEANARARRETDILADGFAQELYPSAAELTLWAVWEPIPYTVSFERNSSRATGTMDDMDLVWDAATNLTACAFTWDGYEFDGWTNASGTVFADQATVSNLTATANDAVTLHARWKAETYEVVLDGGEGGYFEHDTSHSRYTRSVTVGEAYDSILPQPENVDALQQFRGWRYMDRTGVRRTLVPGGMGEVLPKSSGATNLVAVWVTDNPLARAVDIDEEDELFRRFRNSEDNKPGTGWYELEDGDHTKGTSAAAVTWQTGVSAEDQDMTMVVTVVGPGTISFDCKIQSSEDTISVWTGNSDWEKRLESLRFGIRTNENYRNEFVFGLAATAHDWVAVTGPKDTTSARTGSLGWTNVVYELEAEPNETNMFFWTFHYSEEDQPYVGTARVDNVVWRPAGGAEETVAHRVPFAWLRAKFPEYASASGDALEALAEGQSGAKTWADGTPYLVWQDYAAGTDPADPADVLRTHIGVTNGVPYLWCTPPPGAGGADASAYRLLGKGNLSEDLWTPNVPNGAPSEYRFFRYNIVYP